jgi:hypothetical protein
VIWTAASHARVHFGRVIRHASALAPTMCPALRTSANDYFYGLNYMHHTH